MFPEQQRLVESEQRSAHWRRWGPYLSERQWGTVREDYSPGGSAWDYFPHDHARFDVQVEYAKGSPTDLIIRISATNRGPNPALLRVLPTLWFRNTWSWERHDPDP